MFYLFVLDYVLIWFGNNYYYIILNYIILTVTEYICFFLDDGDQSSQDDIRNPAKDKMRNKIHLYNQGLIKTKELFSLKSD